MEHEGWGITVRRRAREQWCPLIVRSPPSSSTRSIFACALRQSRTGPNRGTMAKNAAEKDKPSLISTAPIVYTKILLLLLHFGATIPRISRSQTEVPPTRTHQGDRMKRTILCLSHPYSLSHVAPSECRSSQPCEVEK